MSLDSSSKKIGWSTHENNQLLDYGIFKANYKEKNITIRIEQLYNQLKEKIIEFNPDYIVFEDTPGMNVNIARNLARVHGCILGLCFQYDIGVRDYMPSQWRSVIKLYDKSKDSKKREYQKQKAIEYVNKKYGLNLVYSKNDEETEDDIAEAICIGEAFEILK